MAMAMALVRTAAKTMARATRAPQALQARRMFASSSSRNDADEAAGEEAALYDPYKLYEESTGTRGFREFNPDLIDTEGEDPNFAWEEPEQMMEDKSWPATTGSDLFVDLLNIPNEPPTGKKLDLILKEAYARMGHTGKLDDIKLPEMSVEIPEDHPDREALEIMKLSMMNNGRLQMDDKNDLLKSIIDELDHLRKDKTTLFKGLEQKSESSKKHKKQQH